MDRRLTSIGNDLDRRLTELAAMPLPDKSEKPMVDNAVTALEAGATILDASAGGAGGCPFAPRATGNIATEDLVYLLHGMGVETGVDLDAVIEIGQWLSGALGKELPSMLDKAGGYP